MRLRFLLVHVVAYEWRRVESGGPAAAVLARDAAGLTATLVAGAVDLVGTRGTAGPRGDERAAWVEGVTGGASVKDSVIGVNMKNVDESGVWNALMPGPFKEEPVESYPDEADLEADIEEEGGELPADLKKEEEGKGEGGEEEEVGDASGALVRPRSASASGSGSGARAKPGKPRKPRTFTCRVCGLHVGSGAQMHRHINTHTDEERKASPFARPCPKCDRVLSSGQRLEAHMNSAHGVAGGHPKRRRNLDCPVCGKVLSSPKRLRSHIATHHHSLAAATPQPAPAAVSQ